MEMAEIQILADAIGIASTETIASTAVLDLGCRVGVYYVTCSVDNGDRGDGGGRGAGGDDG